MGLGSCSSRASAAGLGHACWHSGGCEGSNVAESWGDLPDNGHLFPPGYNVVHARCVAACTRLPSGTCMKLLFPCL